MQDKEKVRKMLTPEQYRITQEDWTEVPFTSDLYHNEEEGIYVDVVDWTPLFSSSDKFESWTWWPSFTKPIDSNFLNEISDDTLGMRRTEVRSWNADSHLWHVFPDWPSEAWWMRYCINGAALKFIHRDELKWSEYEKYLKLFE